MFLRPLIFLDCLVLMLLAMTGTVFAATTVPFTVNMSEVVNVTGTPRIAVDVGGVTRYATYASGTGTSALTFNYAMVAGDVDLDGVTLTSPIDLNGGTLKDLNGNDTTLTFTVPNTSNVKISYPSLSMDFTADSDGQYSLNGATYSTLPSLLTATGGSFTRASVGTYFDSSGVMQTAASGTPRFDYNPTTLAAKGILIEETRTNLLLRSSEFDHASWTKTNAIVTPNAITAPDGTSNADMLTTASTTVRLSTSATFALSAGITYTATVFAKAGTCNYLFMEISDFIANAAGAVFDLSSGTTGSNIVFGDGSIITKTITPVGNGWYRASISMKFTAARSAYLALSAPSNTSVSTSTPGVTNYVWGAQLEQGSFPTSYIPTTTTTVTRAADDISIPVASWFNSNNGTLLGSGISNTNGTGAQLLAAIGTDTLDMIGIRQRGTPDAFFMGREPSLAAFDGGGYPIVSLNVLNKIGIAYANSTSGVLSLNGATPQTAGTYLGSYGTSYTKLTAGSFPNAGGYWNGTIQKIKYYPARVSDTQLQLLSQ